MATVTETLDLPGSGTPSNVTVSIELVGTGGYPVESWVTADGTAVVGKLEPTLTAGAWSVVLVANDSMTPTGTVYRRTITGRGFGHYDYFEVPTGSGSHTLFSLLTDVPGAIEQTALAAEAATRAAADTALTAAIAAQATSDAATYALLPGAWQDGSGLLAAGWATSTGVRYRTEPGGTRVQGMFIHVSGSTLALTLPVGYRPSTYRDGVLLVVGVGFLWWTLSTAGAFNVEISTGTQTAIDVLVGP